jgi:metal-responsive CopG/Arc/MetJ family transcriptional regulator
MKVVREKICFTIDPLVNKEFDDYIDENTQNKSKLIEKLIIEFLEKIKDDSKNNQ